MKDKNYEYILSVHWKEGDDLVEHLKAQNNDAKKALISWADSMDQIALHLEKLVEIFEGKELKIEDATDFHISLNGDIKTLEQAVKLNLIYKQKI